MVKLVTSSLHTVRINHGRFLTELPMQKNLTQQNLIQQPVNMLSVFAMVSVMPPINTDAQGQGLAAAAADNLAATGAQGASTSGATSKYFPS